MGRPWCVRGKIRVFRTPFAQRRPYAETAGLGSGRNLLMLKEKIGRDDWIRTSDPLTPSQVRYQAALHPDPRARLEARLAL